MFGKYTVLDSPMYHLDLEPTWWWKFRPITSEDDIRLYRFVMEKPRIWVEIARAELAYAFGGTNIPLEEGEPIISDDYIIQLDDPDAKVNEKVEGIISVLRTMPTELVKELWVALGKANPLLGPNFKEPDQPESEVSTTNSEI